MANDAITFYEPGSDLTVEAAAAITGSRFVKLAGNRSADGNLRVNHGATGKVLGVARADIANGKKGSVISAPGVIVGVLASGALAAGDSVTSDATGRAIVAAGAGGAVVHCAGVVVTAAADATIAQVRLIPHSVTV